MLASETDIATAKARITALTEHAINTSSTVSTNFVVVGSGNTYRDHALAVCHRDISNPGVHTPLCVATEIAVERRRKRFPEERPGITDSFVQFLRTDSLWAPYIVDTGLNYITVDASAPQNVLHSLMMATRSVWEASEESFDLFDEAIAKGLPPKVAFIYAFHNSVSTREYTHVSANSNKNRAIGGTVIGPKSNHRPWGLLCLASIKKYLELDFKPAAAYASYHSTRCQDMFGPVKQEWGGDENAPWLIKDLFNDPEFVGRLSAFRKGRQKEEGVAIPNPFAPAATRVAQAKAGEVTLTEYRTVVLDRLHQLFCIKEEIRNVA